jgi:hypothetical protein
MMLNENIRAICIVKSHIKENTHTENGLNEIHCWLLMFSLRWKVIMNFHMLFQISKLPV